MAASGRTRLVFLAGDPVDHAKGFTEYAEALAGAGLDAAVRHAGSANLLRPAPGSEGWECSMVDGADFLAAAEAAGMVLAGQRVQVLGAGAPGGPWLWPSPSDAVVNCSPVGMGHDAALPLPEGLIPQGGDVYDIVNRPDTPLLLAARRRGCRTDHGRSMMLARIPFVLRWFFERWSPHGCGATHWPGLS